MNLPWIESPFFNEFLVEKNLDEEKKKLAIEYNKNGYITLNGLIESETIDALVIELKEKAFTPEYKPRIPSRDDTRVQDYWMDSDFVKSIACNKQILELLELFYERKPIPFQTLNFRVGTQQKGHSDAIHFNSIPSKYMCGVWVALEDINEENGPLFYYPGSHKLPEYNISDIITEAKTTTYDDYLKYEVFLEKLMVASGLEKKIFKAKKGDLLIWSANLVHGGSPVTNPSLSRFSQVTHYFFENCLYYTPMTSNMVTKELYLRHDLINIKTGNKIEQNYNHQELHPIITNTYKDESVDAKWGYLNFEHQKNNENLKKNTFSSYLRRLINKQ
jgi:hypothetical protein